MKTGIEELNSLLYEIEINEFYELIKDEIHLYSSSEKQELLVAILNRYSGPRFQPDYIKVFDLIIGDGLELNYSIDHWPTTLLGLVVLMAPFKPMFDFFLSKGADINFIGDSYASEGNEPNIDYEFEDSTRYETCLDFAELKLADKFAVDFSNFICPKRLIEENWLELSKKDGTIELSKRDYAYLYDQVEYLHDLVNTELLKDHIVSHGGKRYEEIIQEDKTLT